LSPALTIRESESAEQMVMALNRALPDTHAGRFQGKKRGGDLKEDNIDAFFRVNLKASFSPG